MKKTFLDPNMDVERFDDVMDCLSLSDGDHDEQGPASEQDKDA